MLNDDVTAIQADDSCPVVYPGFPQFKLWPDAVVAVGAVSDMLPRIRSNLEKRAQRSIRGFSLVPLPLRCVYVLAFGEIQEIECLGPQEALVELIRHSYGARVLQTVGTSSHFFQCASIINSVPIRRLKRPRSLASLSDSAQLVEKDLAEAAELTSSADG
jgi:hypothetical protein